MGDSGIRNIENVIHEYAWALDTKNWGALEKVFTEDARGEFADPAYGDQPMSVIRAAFKDGSETGPVALWQHMVTNQIVTQLDSGSARMKAFFLCTWRFKESYQGDRVAFIGGMYENDLTLTEGGWKISVLRATTWWDKGAEDVMPEWRYLGRGPQFG